MPIFYMEKITRKDLRNNPNVLFVFGDNCERRGYGGLAKECRDEPNAVGIRTKYLPEKSNEAYFSDDDYHTVVEMIDDDFHPVVQKLARGGIVVFPTAPLGSGLSAMPSKCPRLFTFLCDYVDSLNKLFNN